MSLDILKEELKVNKIRNLYLFHGPEDFLKKYYLGIIEENILKGDLKTLNRVVMEGRIQPSRLMDTCDEMPFFSDRKIVIVKNSTFFKTRKKADVDENEDEDDGGNQDSGLLTYIQSIPEHTCLVFYENQIGKTAKIFNAIKKKGLIVEFPVQKPADLLKWVVKVFRTSKKEIDQTTASRLLDTCEQGMNELLNEINKVVAYLGDRVKVGPDDIDAVCTRSIRSRIFDLTDAIAERKAEIALKHLNGIISLKEPLPKIMFMITRQFRQVLHFRLLHDEGITLPEIAARFQMSTYIAGKILKQANSFTVDRLKKAMRESLELDLAVKTGRMNDRIALEILITGFTAG